MRSPWDWCREQLLRRINALRFPYLVALTATLFVIDLFFPDVIPWADEILLGPRHGAARAHPAQAAPTDDGRKP